VKDIDIFDTISPMKIAINGFGRIGRSIFKLAKKSGFEVVAINDIMDIQTAEYLLQNDSVYGNCKYDLSGAYYTSFQDNTKLNFNKADVVFECTGLYPYKKQNQHYKSKKVILSYPANDIPTVIYGINSNNEQIISASSCTANAVAPVLKSLESFDLNSCSISVIHSYTSEQSLLDGQYKNDVRSARGAGANIIPLQSSVASELSKIYPNINFSGVNIRVPAINGMILSVNINFNKKINLDEVKTKLKQDKNILFSNNNLVSSDFKYINKSCIVDENMVLVEDNFLNLNIFQDNEKAYVANLIKEAERPKLRG
jgi:glyceraldehyde 3-phosphate dehydrogenase